MLKSKLNVIDLVMMLTNSTLTTAENNIMLLKHCPDSPNCVSSQSINSSHRVSALAFQSQPEQAMLTLKQVMLALPGTQLLEQKEFYLHIQFQTRLFKFIDDVEVFVDASAHIIDIRSASRVGYWDFGANRRRVEQIRAHFHKLDSAQ